MGGFNSEMRIDYQKFLLKLNYIIIIIISFGNTAGAVVERSTAALRVAGSITNTNSCSGSGCLCM